MFDCMSFNYPLIVFQVITNAPMNRDPKLTLLSNFFCPFRDNRKNFTS